ncbi:inorganic pyrophosphatase [Mycena pura]|uniref:inorganic diphosphatase n=1 Tax=Mycena pura TaxID=153505 RepID=A0AAD6Y9T3_9AGAR|nr:inorganic pyrophosphatase [Mycena pura]
MIVVAPRWTSAQMELTPKEAFAPIRQAMRRRRLAYVRSPRVHLELRVAAAGAPLHACEIGERVAQTGDVRSVRVLGILAPRDEDVLCWTLLVIDTTDPLAERLHNIADVDRECPGLITATKEWLRLYKLPDGKGENTFEFDGEVKGTNFAMEIVRTAHEAWQNLVTANPRDAFVDLSNVTIRNSPGIIQSEAADLDRNFAVGIRPPAPESSSVFCGSAAKWWFTYRDRTGLASL